MVDYKLLIHFLVKKSIILLLLYKNDKNHKYLDTDITST